MTAGDSREPSAAPHPDWRASRFGRAAGTYHDSTPVQASMASILANLVPESFHPTTCIEFGCGTGHLTRALTDRFPDLDILATDLSEAMVERARGSWDRPARPQWQVLDGRTPCLPAREFDLLCSNAMVQWFPRLRPHLEACRKMTRAGGVIAVSGFRDDHFPELESVLGRPPFSYAPGPGHAPAAVDAALSEAGWTPISIETLEIVAEYPDASSFLDHLRRSGANRPPPQGQKLSKSSLRLLKAGLQERAGLPGGAIRITWRPWFAVAGAS